MRDNTLERVRRCVAEVLALQGDQVRADSQLMADLGAESLDLVELMYVLEQEFSIRLERDDMSLSGQLGLPEDRIHTDEVLTPEALQLLRERYPQAQALFVEGITRRHLMALLTVRSVCDTIDRKLAAEPGTSTPGDDAPGGAPSGTP